MLEAQVPRPEGRLDAHRHAVRVLLDVGDAVRPEHLGGRALLQLLEHELLDAVLRDVHERPVAERARIDLARDLLPADVGTRHRPRDALGVDVVGAAELVQDLEHVALDQAGLRALLAQLRLGLEDDAADAERREPQRAREADRTGADDADGADVLGH